jgi:hypothetical protein
MTDPNGWPDASKPGYPMNPERDGEHMMERTDDHGRVWHEVWKWRADSKPAEWQQPEFTGGFYGYEPKRLLALAARVPVYAELRYLGPCHTPAEVVALVEAAYRAGAEAMRRAAEDETDCGCAIRNTVIATMMCDGERKARRLCGHDDACLALQAAAIRALPLPKMEEKR